MSHDNDRTGRSLENEVARLYRLLGATTRNRVLIKGYEVDVVAKLAMGPLTIQLLAECKQYSPPTKVSDSDMRDFVVKLLAARECGEADKGAFVTTTGYTKDALATASRHGIDCHTITELYNQLVDFRSYVTAARNGFRASELARWYIDQTGSDIEDYDTLLSPTSESAYLHRPLVAYIDSLFAEGHDRIALLGNFGTGKSSFCKKYLEVLLDRYTQAASDGAAEPARLPVLIELRDFRSGIDIHELIVSSLTRRFNIRLDVPVCLELQRMGRFLLLLDGLDEMATRVDRTVVNENLREIDRLLRDGRNQYLVTCRTHFFQERVADEFLAGYEVVYLVEWTLDDLLAYLKLRFPTNWDGYFSTIRQSRRLKDIARTPQFLEMLMEALGDPAVDDASLGSLGLYGGYVAKWIERESRRRGAIMNATQRQRFAIELATKLFVENRSHIHFSQLYEVARDFSGYTDAARLDYFDSDVRTCTFITKDSQGNYGFKHRSFMEYFCSRKVEEEIVHDAPDVLQKREMTSAIVGFLEELPFDEEAVGRLHEWTALAEKKTQMATTLARNAAAILTARRIPLRPDAARSLQIEMGDWANLQDAIESDDERAFSETLEKLYPLLRRFAGTMLREGLDDADIDDAIQDALLTVWVKRDRGEPAPADFRKYVYTILRHRIYDHLRLRQRRGQLYLEELPPLTGLAATPVVDAVQERELLDNIREALTEREWTFFRLVCLENTPRKEAAEKLGVSRSSLKALLYRVRRKISGLLSGGT